jgi:hypothetical protein
VKDALRREANAVKLVLELYTGSRPEYLVLWVNSSAADVTTANAGGFGAPASEDVASVFGSSSDEVIRDFVRNSNGPQFVDEHVAGLLGMFGEVRGVYFIERSSIPGNIIVESSKVEEVQGSTVVSGKKDAEMHLGVSVQNAVRSTGESLSSEMYALVVYGSPVQ